MNLQLLVDGNNEGSCRIKIFGDFTIYEAHAVLEKLRHHLPELSKYETVKLELGEVSEFDSAGFQVVLSLKKTLYKLGVKFQYGGISDTVNSYFNLVGLLNRENEE